MSYSDPHNQLLPRVNEIHQLIKGFHGQQIAQFEQMIRSIQVVQDQLRQKQEQCQNYINQIKTKKKDQDKLSQLSQGVLKGKSDEIKSKVKNIDAVSTGLKESVSKIKIDKLIRLPVNQERNLKKLFQTIYSTIYTETREPFEWEKFKKLALKHEDGQDFISRLVNINFKDLSSQKYDKLLQLKNDPEFANFSTKTKYSYDIIDLADWVDYTCVGHQYHLQKLRAEKDYDKIRKDMQKKAKGSLQMSQNYWKETSTEIEGYQNQIQSINSELRTIVFGLKKSIGDLEDLGARTNQRLR